MNLYLKGFYNVLKRLLLPLSIAQTSVTCVQPLNIQFPRDAVEKWIDQENNPIALIELKTKRIIISYH